MRKLDFKKIMNDQKDGKLDKKGRRSLQKYSFLVGAVLSIILVTFRLLREPAELLLFFACIDQRIQTRILVVGERQYLEEVSGCNLRSLFRRVWRYAAAESSPDPRCGESPTMQLFGASARLLFRKLYLFYMIFVFLTQPYDKTVLNRTELGSSFAGIAVMAIALVNPSTSSFRLETKHLTGFVVFTS